MTTGAQRRRPSPEGLRSSDGLPSSAGLRLPGADRLLSSRTGYTRETWLAVADHLLDSLNPWFSPSGAQIRLPGRGSWSGADCDGLEGYARSFLLASFRIAATQGDDRLVERYAPGLVAGAAGEWPRLTPCSQQMVEAAAIAVGLHESRGWLWDRLDGPDQQKVVDWLSGFVGSRTWDNNWRLFQVVGEQFLASVGAPYSQDDIDSGLDRIEDWYVGDGWYTDGDGQNFDHYIGWAMHLYPGLWARMAGTAADERLTVYRDRLRRFLEDAVHLVGADGAPVHQGRSLCYRFAAAAPYWMGMLLDASPLTPGQTRRLCSGMLRHFVDHGVPDERGLLSLGWHHHFLPMTQPYSGPGSPYWASKASWDCCCRPSIRCGPTARQHCRSTRTTRSGQCRRRVSWCRAHETTGSCGCSTTAVTTPRLANASRLPTTTTTGSRTRVAPGRS
ncbi:DUF2264 domain-containing protein [Kribbella sp. NPDC002412]